MIINRIVVHYSATRGIVHSFLVDEHRVTKLFKEQKGGKLWQ
mgnify:CR=1 FL=1|jgi:hypothetical protein